MKWVTVVFLLLSCAHQAKFKADTSLVRRYTFELEKQKKFRTPYVAEFNRHGRKLLYVASNHISSVEYPDMTQHPTLKTIHKMFSDHPVEAVIIEGVAPGQDGSVPEGFLKHAGECEKKQWKGPCSESMLVAVEAHRRGLPIYMGEPSEREIRAVIAKEGFTATDLIAAYTLRNIPPMKRQGLTAKEMEAKINQTLERQSRVHLRDTILSIEDFETWYREKMPQPKNYLDIANDDTAPHGGPGASYTQKILHHVSHFRDESVVSVIAEALNKHKVVLVVYGASHLIVEWPALIDMLGEPKNYKVY